MRVVVDKRPFTRGHGIGFSVSWIFISLLLPDKIDDNDKLFIEAAERITMLPGQFRFSEVEVFHFSDFGQKSMVLLSWAVLNMYLINPLDPM